MQIDGLQVTPVQIYGSESEVLSQILSITITLAGQVIFVTLVLLQLEFTDDGAQRMNLFLYGS